MNRRAGTGNRGSIVLWGFLAASGLTLAACDSAGPPSAKPPAATRPAATASTQPGDESPATAPAPGEALVELKLTPPPMAQANPTPIDVPVPNLEPANTAPPVILVPAGTKNVALGKPVTGSDPNPFPGDLSMVTDGKKSGKDGQLDGYYVELAAGRQYVQIDLRGPHKIYAIAVWRLYQPRRACHDVIVQVCDNADFITGVRTLFNNDIDGSAGLGAGTDKAYFESHKGKLIDARGVRARYVRLCSNGSTHGEPNDYVEVEVYGSGVE